MFESGKWRTDADDDDDDSSDEEEAEAAAWNLEKLRQETEALRAKKEEERLAKQGLQPVSNDLPTEDAAEEGESGPSNGTNGSDEVPVETPTETPSETT